MKPEDKEMEAAEDLVLPTIEIKSEADIYNLIFQEDDITWQAVIYELARTRKIDPWDIDISVLTQEFLQTLKKLKEMNFRLSGKVILAAAILLKLKSERLGLEQLLMLTNPEQFPELDDDSDLIDIETEKHFTKAGLRPRIPGVRKRKVTVFELVEALKKALDTDEKRRIRQTTPRELIRPLPEIRRVDIFAKIESVFSRLKDFVKKFKKTTVEFEEILPSKQKMDVIWTFIPLLHLANQDKIILRQDEPFGKIYVDIKEAELAKGLTRTSDSSSRNGKIVRKNLNDNFFMKRTDIGKPEVKEEKLTDNGKGKSRRIKEKT